MKLPPALALLAALRVGSPIAAQTAPGPVPLSPVIVTSELWETPLDRLPASVTVVDEAALRAGQIRHLGDMVDQLSNLTWTGGTSRPRYVQIRGIGENSQFEGETPDSAVRFLVDDLDFTGLGTLAGAFDVRQVEVLRGPQAGAFGANAAGGLVRLVTNAPTSFWTGRIEASAGGDALREGGFAVGGPLAGEQFMARLAAHTHRSDGFRRNVSLNRDTNARDEFSARLRLAGQPAPHWRWDAALLFSELDNGYDEFALNNNGRLTYSDQPGRDEQRSRAASFRASFDGLAGARLTGVSAASGTRSRYSYDDDWTAASYAGFSDLHRDRKVISQELRLDSAATRRALGPIDRWTLGAFGSTTREDTAYSNEDPANLRGLRTRYAADLLALFGQASHHFDQRTRLTLGVRAERVVLDGRGTRTRFRKTRNTFDPVVTFAPSFSDTLLGGKLTLERDLEAGAVAFASLTRGYKAGGVNIDARISPPADPLAYGTETLWNTELGFRGHALDRRLTGELTAFHLARRDTQVRDSAGFGGSYRFFTANARAAHVTGLEAAATYAVTDALTLHATLAHMESELDRFTLTNGSSGGGRRLANTPRYGWTVGARFRDASGFFANADLVARASQFDSNNQNEARRAFRVVHASLGYAWRAWTFTLWARNLLDTRYEKRVYFFGN
ncbi:MAG: TonB-dependent receptor, partial [Opitutaceae bacterium]|nr:TonB-dependent receptor [Opitutaceae bacterium]